MSTTDMETGQSVDERWLKDAQADAFSREMLPSEASLYANSRLRHLRDAPFIPNVEFAPIHEIDDHVAELERLLTPNPELAKRLRGNLRTMTDSTEGLVIDPIQKQAVRDYADMTEWALFGSKGEPLPRGLVFERKDHGPVLELDPRIPYMDSSIHFLDRRWRSGDLNHIVDELESDIERNAGDIAAVVADYLKQSPEYRLMMSFANSPRQLAPQPLNNYWYQLRQGQIEDAVRKDYHLGRELPIARDQAALYDYRRQVFVLDDETIPQKDESQEESDLERAREYLNAVIAKGFEKSFNGRGYFLRLDNNTWIKYIDNNGEEASVSAFPFIKGAVKDLYTSLNAGDTIMRSAVEAFWASIYRDLFDDKNQNLYQLVDEAVRVAAEDAASLLVVTACRTTSILQPDRNEALIRDLTMLRQPTGDVLSEDQYYKLWMNKFSGNEGDGITFEEGMGRSTYEEYRNRKNEELGKVQKHPNSRRDVPTRLITSVRHSGSLAEATSDEDLVLKLPTFHGIPNVIGYKIVSASPKAGRYGFVRSPEDDPYTNCPVPIPANDRLALANAYMSLGLDVLARKVLDTDGLTVTQLEQLIAADGVYKFVKKKSVSSTNARNLNNFTGNVENGRLVGQCSGFSQFLRCSLQKIFGSESAAVVGGLVINRGKKKIDGAEHAQTLFTHNGRTYVLDATPSRRFSREAVSAVGKIAGAGSLSLTSLSLRGLGNSVRGISISMPRLPSMPNFSRPKKDPVKNNWPPPRLLPPPSSNNWPPPHIEQISYEIEKQAILTNTRQQVFEILKITFGLPNDGELYKYVNKLSPYDPARKALEVVIRAEEGLVSGEYVREAVESLKAYSEATPEIIKKLWAGRYQKDFLENLLAMVKPIDGLVR